MARRAESNELQWLIPLGFIALAASAGAVIASGSLTLAGLALGATLGVLLLAAVELAIWMVLAGTLLICGPILMFAPHLWRLAWGFSLLGLFLLVAAGLAAATPRSPWRRAPPRFLWAAMAFMLLAAASLALPESVAAEAVPALKRYFQYWGLMFVLAAIPMSGRFVLRLAGFMILLALVQIPLALYQRIVLVPQRWNLPNRVVPIDVVTGTFEGTLQAGSANAVMALMLCAVLAMICAARRERLLGRGMAWALGLAVVVPLALGETKIVLVLLPLALLMVYGDLIGRRPFAFASGAVLVAAVLAGLGWSYMMLQNTDDMNDPIGTRIESTIDYNFGDVGHHGGASVNRTTALTFWWQRHASGDPVPLLLGHGLGSTYLSEETRIRGHMERLHGGVAIGLSSASILLWELGLVGFCIYASVLVLAWTACLRLTMQARPGLDRAMCRTLLAASVLPMVMLLHSDYMMHTPSMQVLMGVTLGLIARRYRMAGGQVA